MPKRNITKNSAFVILLSAFCFALTCCGTSTADTISDDQKAPFDAPQITGRLASDDITESSGLAASKCQPGVYWTHNDSGDAAFIFAIDEKGEDLGTWRVSGASNKDWEDIAESKGADGKCYLYIGEIGNNKLERDELAVYKVAEPTVGDASRNTTRRESLETEPASVLRFKYPDVTQNAETLMVQPTTGDVYVLSKSRSEPSVVYKLKPEFGDGVQTAAVVAKITVPAVPNGLLTGGDISADGKHVVLCDYFAGYELTLPASSKNFDDIWKEKPVRLDLANRDTGEAVAYTLDGDAIVATSEGRRTAIIKAVRKAK